MRHTLLRTQPVPVLVTLLLCLTPCGAGAAEPFYMGADVSLQSFMQQRGVSFKADGIARPADQILYNAGANMFRLRLFVNPNTNYASTNGAIQDLNYDIALARQIKIDAPGARLLLDLQYSDSWADPGKQATPAAWTGQTLTQLQTTVENYTQSTLTAFNAAGVMPSMVQLGNEVQSGMLWNTGSIDFAGTTAQQKATWQSFGGLMNSAIRGVRDAEAGTGAGIQIAIHPGASNVSSFFFQHLTDPSYGNVNAGSFDIMGVSYYPSQANQLLSLRSDLTGLIAQYDKKVMVLETQAPWETSSPPVPTDPGYPSTPAGQKQFLTDLRNTIASLPNGDGAGIIYWYPESVQVPGYTIYNGGATALFDNNGNALSAVSDFAVPEPGIGGLIACMVLLLFLRPERIKAR